MVEIIQDNGQTSILIVEDSANYSTILKRLLTSGLGFSDVETVPDTEKAMAAILASPGRFNLLFVDFHYPVGDNGATFLANLRAQKLMEKRMAFIITSDPSLETMREANAAGAVGVVAKPFDIGQLRQQIERAKRVIFADSLDYLTD